MFKYAFQKFLLAHSLKILVMIYQATSIPLQIRLTFLRNTTWSKDKNNGKRQRDHILFSFSLVRCNIDWNIEKLVLSTY